MRVFVYWNLHRNLWSVKALEGPHKGLVVAHRESLTIEGAAPRVSQRGRDRVLREGRKNVHAGIVGYVSPFDTPEGATEWPQATYNPYKGPCFVHKGGPLEGEPWAGAPVVYMGHKRVHFVPPLAPVASEG
jgi:hypothetical protein